MKYRFSKKALLLAFILFSNSCTQEASKNKSTTIPIKIYEPFIAVQPLGKVEEYILDSINKTLRKTYPFKIVMRKSVELPIRFKSKRGANRYRADSIIRYLAKLDIDAYKVIGITGLEIATTKYSDSKIKTIKKPEWRYKDWGIFGLGFCPGRSCVVSYCYLKQRDKNKMMSRVRKITIHEVGHTLGLPHCIDKNCVMTDACEKIATIDKTKGVLCKKCKSAIKLFN